MSPLQEWVERAATAIELLAVVIIVVTIAYSTLVYVGRLARGLADDTTYKGYRHQLARALLLGLELLVAADIINTVAIEPTLDSVLVLGAIVLIRTFLSFSLETEIEGCWPWQRRAVRAGDGAKTRLER
jgi:uncharacterized membrane protein